MLIDTTPTWNNVSINTLNIPFRFPLVNEKETTCAAESLSEILCTGMNVEYRIQGQYTEAWSQSKNSATLLHRIDQDTT